MPPKTHRQGGDDERDEMPWVNEAWRNADPKRQNRTLQEWKEHFRSLSKSLSYTNRFGASAQGIRMREIDAFVRVQDILTHRDYSRNGYSMADVMTLVDNCPKQRFATCAALVTYTYVEHQRQPFLVRMLEELHNCGINLVEEKGLQEQGIKLKDKEGTSVTLMALRSISEEHFPLHFRLNVEGQRAFIRCQQGHDMSRLQVQLDRNIMHDRLTKRNCPQMAVHGTFHSLVDTIMKEGLKPRRDDIHLAACLPEDTELGTSGCRGGTDSYLHIDIRGAMDSGIQFWLSDNNVILTPGNESGVLPPEFIRGATDAKGSKVLRAGMAWAREGFRPGMTAPDLKLKALSDLSPMERDFLKVAKNVRAILGIQKQMESGEKVEKNQAEKLANKSEFLAKLKGTAEKLNSSPAGLELLAKNQDVLVLLSA